MNDPYPNITDAVLEPFKQGFGNGLSMLRAPHRSLGVLAASLRQLLDVVIPAGQPKPNR